ncbi:MAG: hypothetical protein ACFFB2_02695 [Promethearchaeota archaeon]
MTELTPHGCQNQATDIQTHPSIFFCLVMKESLSDCPIKCPYFVQGTPTLMEHIYNSNYELECPYLHLIAKIDTQDEQWFVCGKTAKDPNPHEC